MVCGLLMTAWLGVVLFGLVNNIDLLALCALVVGFTGLFGLLIFLFGLFVVCFALVISWIVLILCWPY